MKNSEPSFILKVQKDHRVFFKQHKIDGVDKRVQYLKKLKEILKKKESIIMDALFLDLKKPAFESYTSEILMVQKERVLMVCSQSVATVRVREWHKKNTESILSVFFDFKLGLLLFIFSCIIFNVSLISCILYHNRC